MTYKIICMKDCIVHIIQGQCSENIYMGKHTLPKFKEGLRAMEPEDASCLLEKIRLYFEKPLRLDNENASVSAVLG